ncbi:unnamed protein product [Litomosoides sigmodontis]|uniref:C2H2-type domain-containing protein n=1 Tax=Litomosoides sigmodontis TaxID=42156 RepID=A0A3P6TTS0_LITSI|nr:unnamed protein product [Litomosoides sigmodontis]
MLASTQSLLPLLSVPMINQHPMNLITSNITFSTSQCPMCSRIYKSSKDLQDHVLTHHERKYECEKCARTFVSEKRMRTHELKKHSAHATNSVKEANGGRKLFECNQCDRTYETFYNFKEHLAKHKGKLFRCTICSKHLSGQSALSRHAKIHEKPHECMMCNSRFSSAYDLDCKLRHERLCSLKNTIIKKVSHSQASTICQKPSPCREGIIVGAKLKDEVLKKSDDNQMFLAVATKIYEMNLCLFPVCSYYLSYVFDCIKIEDARNLEYC